MQLAFRSCLYGGPERGADNPGAEQLRKAEDGAKRRGHLVSGRELPARPWAARLRDMAGGGTAGEFAGAVAGNRAGMGRGLVPVHGHRAPRGHRAPQRAHRPGGQSRQAHRPGGQSRQAHRPGRQTRQLDRGGRAAGRRCGLRDRRAVSRVPVRGEPGRRCRRSRPARDLPGHLAGRRAAGPVRGSQAAGGRAARAGHHHRHVRLLPRRPRHDFRRLQPAGSRAGLGADWLAAVRRGRRAGCLATRAGRAPHAGNLPATGARPGRWRSPGCWRPARPWRSPRPGTATRCGRPRI